MESRNLSILSELHLLHEYEDMGLIRILFQFFLSCIGGAVRLPTNGVRKTFNSF